jgi:hypothetical protein
MPVIASTASVSGRPWSMHSERQVQNEVAWPEWLPDLIARYHLTPPPGA